MLQFERKGVGAPAIWLEMAAASSSSPGELLPASAINAVIKRVAASKGVSFATDARAAVVKAATMYIFMLMDE